MNLYLINAGMTISVICFYIGYYFRNSNNQLHRKINIAGVLVNLATALFLLTHKYLMNGIEAAGIFPTVSPTIILYSPILCCGEFGINAYHGIHRNYKKSRDFIKNYILFFYLFTLSYLYLDFLFLKQGIKT
jgi:hypothetical protein